MKLRATVAVAAMLLSTAAFASRCPGDMKKIDEALAKSPKLTEAQMSEVKKQRAEGEALHKAGNHGASVEKLGKAMSILDIQ